MKLLRAECHGFGKLVGVSLVFGPGLNLVLGPNEAGKSTLVDAVMAALYGLKGRATALRDLKELRAPWQAEAPYAVTLTLATRQGQELLLHRELTDNHLQVWRKTASGLLPADESDLQAVLVSLGAPSLSLFTSAFLVRQAEVASLDRKTIGEALVEKLTEGEAAVTAREALRKLERRQKELVRGGDRQPGLLAQAGERLRRCEDALDRTSHKADRYYEALAESQSLRAQRDAARSELERLTPLVRGYEGLQQVEEELAWRQAELAREAGRLDDYQRLGRQLAAAEEEFAGLSAAVRYDAWRERTGETIEGLERSLEGLEQQLGAARDEARGREEKLRDTGVRLDALREEMRQADPEGLGEALLLRVEELARERDEHLRQAEDRQAQADLLGPRAVLAGWCFRGFLVALVLAGGLLSAWLSGWPSAVWGALGAAAVAGLLLGGYLRTMGEVRHRDLLETEAAHVRREARNLEGRLGKLAGGGTLGDLRERVRQALALGARIADLERSQAALALALEMSGTGGLEEVIGQHRQRVGALLGELGVATLEEARKLVTRRRELIGCRDVLRAEMAGLLGQEGPDDLKGKVDGLAGEVAALLARRDAVRQELRVELKPHEYAAYAERLPELGGELGETEGSLERVDERVRVLRADLMEGDPWELAAQIDAERQDIARLEREAQALDVAYQVLAEATEEAQRMVAPTLQERAGGLLADLTGNRYRELAVEVREGELEVKVRSPETGAFVPDATLSAGTRDQLYLALRVALAEYLSGTTECPLILDDAFVHYDAFRLANAAAALTTLASVRQIIWFSKDDALPALVPGASVLRL